MPKLKITWESQHDKISQFPPSDADKNKQEKHQLKADTNRF